MNNKKRNYLIIIIFGLILTLMLVGINNIYGSKTDWLPQHTTFPEVFRQLFYSTKNILPNFVFNIGGGQNIFNFSYYGLLSPVILISYFLPFLNMQIFIMLASFILYIASGILTYKFLIHNKIPSNISLLLSLCFLSLAPLTFHFHYHIMFVWYYPFLILALLGVDKYLEKKSSFLLIISIFLIILTNYYYAISSLFTILIYGVYKLLEKTNNFKEFILASLKASLRLIIPILLASFILLPSLYTIFNSNRSSTDTLNILNLFIFKPKESFYSSFSIGISALFLLALLGNLSLKKNNKQNYFLNITLLAITIFPLFSYILNGFLYARGKILIPLAILYIYILAKFVLNILSNQINYRLFSKLLIVTIILTTIPNLKNYLTYISLADIVISLLSIYIFYKKKKLKYLFTPLLIILIASSFINNTNSKYLTKSSYEELTKEKKTIQKLIESIDDSSIYRLDTTTSANNQANMIYSSNHLSTSIYSSNFNPYYHEFYNYTSGNNNVSRNNLISSSTFNPFFHNLMGTKYLISKTNLDNYYQKIKTIDNYSLYYNSKAYPLAYFVQKNKDMNKYAELKFPYNLEYLYNTDTSKSSIKELKTENTEYKFNFFEDTTYQFSLNENISDKYLLISFDMAYNSTCKEGDLSIEINNQKNKLTCSSWLYHNQNFNFKYILPGQEAQNLIIKFSKGKYHINNLKVFSMDEPKFSYQPFENLKINLKNSSIKGKITTETPGYIITSIPYDKGFTILDNNKEIEYEKVNSAFVGFKVNKGTHNITIKYKSPFLKTGFIISLCGLMGLIILIFSEQLKNKKSSKVKK